jgi:putative SOS response-associated peptidase YedK
MCGRYTLTADLSFLQARFGFEVEEVAFAPRYNIAPTQEVLTVVNDGSRSQGHMMRWGLVPFWAKDPNIGNRMINARAETVVENKVFRQVFPKQRCLVIADSFYEWKKNGKSKVPMRIMLKSEEPFAFAGLWSAWKPREGGNPEPLYSCTIITTVPNALMEPIHNRMPVILSRESESLWLDTTRSDTGELRELLLPYSADEMTAYQVSTIVNSPKNNDPRCIEPVQPGSVRQLPL